MTKILGIDLGTTNSVMAVIEAGDPTILENAEGNRLTPSVVAVNPKTGEQIVGQVARRQAITNPENTVFSVKRFMGRKFSDPQVQEALKHVPYTVKAASNGDVRVVMGGKEFSPPEVSAMILRKLKQDAEAKLGETITQAVITVPAYFNDSQRQATKDAGQIAGLEVLRIINEPTAASLAYGLDKKGAEQTIAVYDLGGGTFDVSILRVGEGVFEVISTNGDTFLGGDDFDLRIIEWAVDEYRKDQGIDLRQDKMALQRLKEAAEKAKIELSTTLQTDLNLPFITADASGPKHLALTLSRARLEQLTADLVERTVGPCKAALRDAGLEPSQIDEVVLVGGQTRMPCVAEQVKAVFNREPHKGVNPDEVVAVGAAIQAGVLAGDVKDILLLDVCPLTLGLETLGGVMTPLIPRNTTIPTAKGETFTTAADGQTSVEVHVLQGERPMAAENKSLARFILDGLLPAPRGLPQIEVAFDIDANGILNVSAKDKTTGKEQKIVIQASSGLAKDEIDRMVREAELHAEDDRRLREEIEERNRADSLAYQAEKIVRESGDTLPSDLKTEVEEKTKTLQDALRANDITAMREAQTALQEALNRAGQAVYTAQAQRTEGDVGTNGQAPESGKHGSGSPSGSVEGEYREV